uniref:Uncharacterized protein n=1 Tax=Candidatus Kentrum sp. DK TaxID=2126562 RepID=A0A450SBM2_9GAMM|nr:MAG: hypothetical protein BECKDK2373C_GA0170839_102636 [Candidatus Kentron sp. DK]
MPNEKSDLRNGDRRNDTQGHDTDTATRQNGASEKSSAGTGTHHIDNRQDNQSTETQAPAVYVGNYRPSVTAANNSAFYTNKNFAVTE